ncbi:PTS system trehalose-specific EIIBC component [Ruminococcus sp. Marseille-P6503]|uniref:PTS system trehalose-specific EIIBC component n=1 Tax=Ruminococcus sp. Marseille-P6503 TaxID=2364796 RepID=UPI000F52B103|nr:PTS system trehalose-specific EIIBC component [Ruminococcus sp. Marseille-P6503]
MGKYQKDAAMLLDLVGGTRNIKAVTHCMTRMRFVLADAKLADTKAIEELSAVKGTFTQAGQFQVIIGNDVSEFYKEFTAGAGIEGVNKEAAKEAAKSNQSLLQRIMSNLGEIFAPIIPALICGGLILGFRNIIGEINFFENGTKSLADISQFWAGLYSFLWLIGEAVFHLLPVGIVWSITKKMGTTQILGIILGLTLISPQLLNGFSVAQTNASDIPVWDFGFAQVQMIGYQGQVISAILAGFVLVYLEKLFRKICPDVISMIVVPFCSLVPAVIIAHTVVGPIGWKIGDGIANVVYNGLTSNYGVIFAGVFGLLYAPVVMTGLHHMTNAIDTTLSTMYGGTILWPMIALSNIAQGSAVLAMAVLQRKNNQAKQINIPALISCYLGVTEPALFGVNLKYGFPLFCGMIGSAAAAMVSVGFGVQAFSIGVGGIPGILSIKTEFWSIFLLCMAISIIVPFVLTFIVGKKKLAAEAIGSQQSETESAAAPESQKEPEEATNSVYAPVSGKVIPISEVPDDVFSQKILGDGIAVEPQGNVITAPCDAEVSVVMEDSNHACGLKLSNDMEILIHVGINTVDMNGDGFTMFVSVGDHVKKGDKLIEFSPEKIRAAGHPTTTVICVTEEGSAQQIQFSSGMDCIAGETKLIAWE